MVEEALERVLALAGGEPLADAFFHFFERRDTRGFLFEESRDVKTERRAEDGADVARAQVEDDFVELLDHLAAGEPAQVAALLGTIGVARGEVLERGAGAELGFDRAQGFQRRAGIVALGGVFHDVRGVYEFRHLELGAMRAVVLDDVLAADLADAPGVARHETVDAQAQLDLRRQNRNARAAARGAGRGGMLAGERGFDRFAGQRLGIGERGLVQEFAFDDVFERPFAQSPVNVGGRCARHGGGEMRTEPASLGLNQRVVERLAVNDCRHVLATTILQSMRSIGVGRRGGRGTLYPQTMGCLNSIESIVHEVVTRYQEEIERLRAMPAAPEERLFHSPAARALKEEILAVGKKLWLREFVDGNGGNISCRLTDDLVLATPTMRSKYDLRIEDISLVDLNNRRICGSQPHTSEILLHLTIYRNCPSARAVVHCHPPHATAYSITGIEPPLGVLPEYEVFVGVARVSGYDTPGTQAFADTVLPYVAEHNTVLLANHGIVCWADTVTHAEWQAEVLDTYCRTLMLAAQLGKPVTHIPPPKVADLVRLKKKLGLPDPRHETNGAAPPMAAAAPPAKPGVEGVGDERIRILAKHIAAELAERLRAR